MMAFLLIRQTLLPPTTGTLIPQATGRAAVPDQGRGWHRSSLALGLFTSLTNVKGSTWPSVNGLAMSPSYVMASRRTKITAAALA